MSVRINLTLEASEMFLSLHMIFSLERAAVVWAILERISGFDPSLEMIVVVLSRRSVRTPASSSSSAFTTMSSAKRKFVMSRPPMLTLPSWSSKASHMILSKKMLKRVGESTHPCRTPTASLNHSPVLPLNRTALWALSYRFSMARMMLALMLFFLIVAHKASCHTLSKAFLKSMKTW